MGTKNNPGAFDCYANALPDEPQFTLLARDPAAPSLLIRWSLDREHEIGMGRRPASDMEMVKEARDCARAMVLWRAENDGAWRAVPGDRRTKNMDGPYWFSCATETGGTGENRRKLERRKKDFGGQFVGLDVETGAALRGPDRRHPSEGDHHGG